MIDTRRLRLDSPARSPGQQAEALTAGQHDPLPALPPPKNVTEGGWGTPYGVRATRQGPVALASLSRVSRPCDRGAVQQRRGRRRRQQARPDPLRGRALSSFTFRQGVPAHSPRLLAGGSSGSPFLADRRSAPAGALAIVDVDAETPPGQVSPRFASFPGRPRPPGTRHKSSRRGLEATWHPSGQHPGLWAGVLRSK